ncbi:MAG: Class cytochrome family [Deltaproteobacteria bacterium]|nr:Class cytochrome family [Deltaproteobacteria bacterium]
MRRVAFWTALVVAIVFAAGTGFAAAPDKPIVLKAAKAKGPVTFDHAKHGKDCASCHHKDKAGAEQKCTKCHGDKTEGKKLSAKEGRRSPRRRRSTPSARIATRRRTRAPSRSAKIAIRSSRQPTGRIDPADAPAGEGAGGSPAPFFFGGITPGSGS